MSRASLALVAIVKDEEPFVEEWLAYHRLLGVDHFYLYDDDPARPLAPQLRPFADFVTVIPWGDGHRELPGRNRQTKAYTDALGRLGETWVTFVDCDEFIVLRDHASLPAFVASFAGASAVRLHWHVFGHCGHFHNPLLVTADLTRRRLAPNRLTKSINRASAIAEIDSAHFCHLRAGALTVDANGRPFEEALYPGKTDVAHVNHYMCRSFRSWMRRAQRGEAAFDAPIDDPRHRWRFTEEGLLRKFVEITKDVNEHVDDFMLRYREPIETFLTALLDA